MNQIIVREEFGWKLYQNNFIKLWFSGYLTGGSSVKLLLLEITAFSNTGDIDIDFLSKWVCKISGHFALIVKFTDDSCFLAVDKICSIPIFDVTKDKGCIVSNYAPYLKESLNLDDSNVDFQSLLEISMSGFSIGSKTIYPDVKRLMAGECVLWRGEKRYKSYYYTYFPWNDSACNYIELKDDFKKVCLTTIEKLIKSVNGRQIVVPLSAGNDSRLIVSCLKKLSYENVICLSYGRRGTYEVGASKKVARTLGYEWIYIQDTIKEKRAFFKSTIYGDYVKAFESYASVPNLQDVYEIYTLKSKDVINNDAVIVNGNSGDFISGGHIPENLELSESFLGNGDIKWKLFLEKHYSIWKKLRTNLNDEIIISELSKIISERFQSDKKNTVLLYSIIEGMECIGRQSRLVANQQRAYDFVGYEWRLPLWSEDFLDFWEKVPPQYKVRQLLYKDVLMENNWGRVWRDIDVNKKLIRPHSLRIIRLIVKILTSPFGKKAWHRIEKNVLYYWMHQSYAVTVVSYWRSLFDRCGQRNINSWTADQFVKRNGFKSVLYIHKKIKILKSLV